MFFLQKRNSFLAFCSSKIDTTASVWNTYEPSDVVKEVEGSIEVSIDALESNLELQKLKNELRFSGHTQERMLPRMESQLKLCSGKEMSHFLTRLASRTYA